MITRRVLDLIETRMARRPPEYIPEDGRAIYDGFHVLVVGGGLAGSIFARQFLRRTDHLGVEARITIINAINCNYCGGLITGLAAGGLDRLCGLPLPRERILTTVNRCYYANPYGLAEVALTSPLYSILRTSRFGEPGFDDSLKERITDGLSPRASSRLTVIEPARALEAFPPNPGGERARVRYTRYAREGNPVIEEISGDFLVMAAGLRSLGTKVLSSFEESSGYRFPRTMEASVTEIDLGAARHNRLGDGVMMVDGILPGCVVALIPKRRTWLTLTSVGRALTPADLGTIFGHQTVRRVVDLLDPLAGLRCGHICRAKVFLGSSPRFSGHGWLAIGDLTGCGRLFKDGYYAAIYGADLAARAVIHRGLSEGDLRRYYAHPLRRWAAVDNQAGLSLFRLGLGLGPSPWFGRLLHDLAAREAVHGTLGGPVHSAFRAIASGELTYRWIGGLLAWGMINYLVGLPFRSRTSVGTATKS